MPDEDRLPLRSTLKLFSRLTLHAYRDLAPEERAELLAELQRAQRELVLLQFADVKGRALLAAIDAPGADMRALVHRHLDPVLTADVHDAEAVLAEILALDLASVPPGFERLEALTGELCAIMDDRTRPLVLSGARAADDAGGGMCKCDKCGIVVARVAGWPIPGNTHFRRRSPKRSDSCGKWQAYPKRES